MKFLNFIALILISPVYCFGSEMRSLYGIHLQGTEIQGSTIDSHWVYSWVQCVSLCLDTSGCVAVSFNCGVFLHKTEICQLKSAFNNTVIFQQMCSIVPYEALNKPFDSQITSHNVSEMTSETTSGMTSQIILDMTSQANSGMTSQSMSEVTTQTILEMTSQDNAGMTSQENSWMTSQDSGMTSQSMSEVTTQTILEMTSQDNAGMTSQENSGMTSQDNSGMTSQSMPEVTSQTILEMTSQDNAGMTSQDNSGMTSQSMSEVTTQTPSQMSPSLTTDIVTTTTNNQGSILAVIESLQDMCSVGSTYDISILTPDGVYIYDSYLDLESGPCRGPEPFSTIFNGYPGLPDISLVSSILSYQVNVIDLYANGNVYRWMASSTHVTKQTGFPKPIMNHIGSIGGSYPDNPMWSIYRGRNGEQMFFYQDGIYYMYCYQSCTSQQFYLGDVILDQNNNNLNVWSSLPPDVVSICSVDNQHLFYLIFDKYNNYFLYQLDNAANPAITVTPKGQVQF